MPRVSLGRVCVLSTAATSADTMTLLDEEKKTFGLTVCCQPETRRKWSVTRFNSNTQRRNLYLKNATLSLVLLSRKRRALLIERPAHSRLVLREQIKYTSAERK